MIHNNFSGIISDDLDTLTDIGDSTLMRKTTAKLDPLSVLNKMERKARCKSPHRSFAHSSPNRLTNKNNVPKFTSTVCKDKQTNRAALSPMRKALF